MTTSEITRIDPPMTGDERAVLDGFLDYQRATVHHKCRGLSDSDAHRVLLPSELTTVAALVSHLRWVEAYWFGTVLDGQPDRAPYSAADPDGEFRAAAGRPLAELLAEYAQECERSRIITAGLALGAEVPFRDRGRLNVRWVLAHMIDETARHAGHLDLLREQLDGVTGE
ncbi:MAG: DinB family protein [Sciscionella sp.]